MSLARWGWLLVCLLLLGACAGPQSRAPLPAPEQQQRIAELGGWTHWGLSARLGLDDGRDGGSGRLDWSVSGQQSLLHFRGALGQGAWQLELDGQGATLTRADGSVSSDDDLQALLWRETGWQVPVAALQWWVRGLAEPGSGQQPELGADGLPASLEQDGWQVSFLRYMDFQGQQLPRRLEAVRGDVRLKLAVSSWRQGDDEGA